MESVDKEKDCTMTGLVRDSVAATMDSCTTPKIINAIEKIYGDPAWRENNGSRNVEVGWMECARGGGATEEGSSGKMACATKYKKDYLSKTVLHPWRV